MLVILALAIPAVLGLKRSIKALKVKFSAVARRPVGDVSLKSRKVKPLTQVGPPLPRPRPGPLRGPTSKWRRSSRG